MCVFICERLDAPFGRYPKPETLATIHIPKPEVLLGLSFSLSKYVYLAACLGFNFDGCIPHAQDVDLRMSGRPD